MSITGDDSRIRTLRSAGDEAVPDRAESVLAAALAAIVTVNVTILIGEDLRTVLESALSVITAVAASIG